MIAARIPQSHDTWRVQRFLLVEMHVKAARVS